MSGWVVYVEFEHRADADRFFDALGDWLCEDVVQSVGEGPRYLMYDDASPCLGPMRDLTG